MSSWEGKLPSFDELWQQGKNLMVNPMEKETIPPVKPMAMANPDMMRGGNPDAERPGALMMPTDTGAPASSFPSLAKLMTGWNKAMASPETAAALANAGRAVVNIGGWKGMPVNDFTNSVYDAATKYSQSQANRKANVIPTGGGVRPGATGVVATPGSTVSGTSGTRMSEEAQRKLYEDLFAKAMNGFGGVK